MFAVGLQMAIKLNQVKSSYAQLLLTSRITHNMYD